MPIVSVKKERLFKGLGREYTFEEFLNLCFLFGLECESTTEEEEKRKEKGVETNEEIESEEEEIYKVEVAANRYDLLCEEGIINGLKTFLGEMKKIEYKTFESNDKNMKMTVHFDETSQIRPFVVCAVLRDISFNEETFKNFIQLQDKLHQNICRKRSLVAIGTHDLDTIQGPFTYRSLPPKTIKFIPLSQQKEVDAVELMNIYETDEKYKHLKPYVPLIKNSSVYPVIFDSKNTVLSLPPIINGDHSKMSANTKNVFIECTATDLTKANIVLNMMVTMFSKYCKKPYTAEKVEVIYKSSSTDKVVIKNGEKMPTKYNTPNLEDITFEIDIDYINKKIGGDVNLSKEKVNELLKKMMLYPKQHPEKKNILIVSVPPTRPDVLHPCDIMEDVAIAYGYNNIKKTIPKTNTMGKNNKLNHLTDLLRLECGLTGYTEALTLALCSHDEIFKFMNIEDDGKTAVTLSKPKTSFFQCCRTTLIPGLLKTIENNIKFGYPQKYFEISDVVFKDNTIDVGARNQRNVAAVYCNLNAGLELIQGFIERLMEVLGIPLDKDNGFYLKASNNKTYLQGRSADIYLKGEIIGNFGTLSPDVSMAFGIKNPVSAFEFNIEKAIKYCEE